MSETAHLKDQLRAYFDGIGFERWSAIYGEGKLSPIRRSIRDGHTAMLTHSLRWLRERFPQLPPSAQALDAGCGTGLFSTMLAQHGFQVTAVDIAAQMVAAAAQQVQQQQLHERVHFVVDDLESFSQRNDVPQVYDLVACFDVLVHYPASAFVPLCTSLARMSRNMLLLTYAPYEPLLAALHRVGAYFPKSQRRTEIQMIPEQLVHQTLAAAGMQVQRSIRVSKGFYHVTLLEAWREGQLIPAI